MKKKIVEGIKLEETDKNEKLIDFGEALELIKNELSDYAKVKPQLINFIENFRLQNIHKFSKDQF